MVPSPHPCGLFQKCLDPLPGCVFRRCSGPFPSCLFGRCLGHFPVCFILFQLFTYMQLFPFTKSRLHAVIETLSFLLNCPPTACLSVSCPPLGDLNSLPILLACTIIWQLRRIKNRSTWEPLILDHLWPWIDSDCTSGDHRTALPLPRGRPSNTGPDRRSSDRHQLTEAWSRCAWFKYVPTSTCET